jgi:hypothetical protein
VDPAVVHDEDYFQRLENLVQKSKDKRGYNALKVRDFLTTFKLNILISLLRKKDPFVSPHSESKDGHI